METPTSQRRSTRLLEKPTYWHALTMSRRPSVTEVLAEWWDAVSFWRTPTRLLPALFAAFHVATFLVFLVFMVRYFSIRWLVVLSAIGTMLGTVYNTVWYHRYCTHGVFTFRSIWFARLFLWTNPVGFREESYVIPHRIHHTNSDRLGDPYGPHLGWLGTYLAIESTQKANRDISRTDYERLCRSLAHIGFVANSYDRFRRTGSVENVWHYGARTVVANALWAGLAAALGGLQGAMAWYAGIFVFTFVIRDFNFRGHGGFFGTRRTASPVNNLIFGLIAGEWHDNHHAYPRAARNGFAWWQIDLPYWVIRLMSACGMVTDFNRSGDRAADC